MSGSPTPEHPLESRVEEFEKWWATQKWWPGHKHTARHAWNAALQSQGARMERYREGFNGPADWGEWNQRVEDFLADIEAKETALSESSRLSGRPYAMRHGWRWAWNDIRRGAIVVALRTLWWAIVRGHDGETCADCGRPYLLWHSPDDLWERLSGRAGLLCPSCFDRRATTSGLTLRWRPEVLPGER